MTNKTPPIRAITFDFWRTLFYADSRLPERRRARVEAVVRATGCSFDAGKEAMKDAANEFLRVHISEQRTLHPRDAIPMVEQRLGVRIEEEAALQLAIDLADALLEHPPEPIENALDAIRVAAGHLPVGIISDTGLSPGSHMRVLFDRHSVLEHITSLTFSDEIGVAKPQEKAFHHAAAQLGVEPTELLHIGDLEPTDVKGARKVGAQAALFIGDNDRYVEGSQAHYIFKSWDEFMKRLPEVLAD